MTDPAPQPPADPPAPPPPPDVPSFGTSPADASSSFADAAPAPETPLSGLELGPSEPPAEALTHVVDDYVDREEPTRWAAEQMLAGRPFEEIEDTLAVQGWGPEDVLLIVEDAREQTKRARGVTTREDVVRGAAKRNWQSYRRIRWLVLVVVGGILLVIYLFLHGR